MRSLCSIAAVALSLLGGACWAGQPNRFLLSLELGGDRLEGTPLAWSSKNVILLERDGRVRNVDPQQVSKFQKTTQTFESFSHSMLKSKLREEFDGSFEVTSTAHYVVVHPRGQGERWSRLFEDLYRSFTHYFSVRGFQIENPEFPLVAIVLRNQAEFHRYCGKQGDAVPGGLLGYYSSTTNRTALYDIGGGRGDDRSWGRNAETIIHEATHQAAFNTGIHNRFTAPPRFVAEGLGTLFEAPGIWNSRDYPKAPDRLNRGRLAEFKQQTAAGKRTPQRFAELVASDRLFKTDPSGAYAEAWAFTHYLVETQPRQYSKYLKRTADHLDFIECTSKQRLDDFTAVFGSNLQLLDAQFLQHMTTVK